MSSSESEDENIVRYGTPLEPFEEDEIPSKRKYQQQSDQFAVDAHGRRKFHGAFTGGFSAGHGNTVGTPEGWTPASFKSSRSEKAQTSSQRPEDFMDEEDRSEFGIAPRHIQTQNEYSGQKRQRQQRFHDGPIPGEPVLEQLVRAVHETAAVRMLRAMGWREGQGVGGRVTRDEKKRAKQHHKVYGCYLPPEMRENQPQSDEDSSDSEFEYDILFAPDDYEPYVLQPKNDLFGLGYSGLSRHSVLGNMAGEYGSEAGTSRSHLVMKDKGKKVSIRGQAFGVGALEAEDEDIYATEDMSHYDFELGGPARDKQKKKSANKNKNADVLEGFVKSSKPLPPVASYPPPALPRDFRPALPAAKRSRFEPTTQPQRDQGLGRHELTAEARGKLLGEEPAPKTNAQTDKAPDDPIVKIVGRNVNFISTNVVLNEDVNKEKELDFIPITDSGKELAKVFKPFMNNPQKQARYERYLKNNDSFPIERDEDKLSEWERNRELVEFEQSAKLYKPLSSNDRFTHATEPDDGALNPLCAVAKSSTNYGLVTAEQIEAANKGLYGVMTRRQTAWQPEALVCKRFNVPDPMAVRAEPKKEEKSKISYSVFSYLETSVHSKESFAKEQSKFSGSKSLNLNVIPKTNQTKDNNQGLNDLNRKSDPKSESDVGITGFNKRLTVAELFLKESEKDLENKDQVGTEVTETINKFDKMDLYKSIFLSDSENEEENTTRNEVKDQNKTEDDFIDVPKNVERNLSPPRGIFANIDFDEINSWKRNADKKVDNKQTGVEDSVNKEKVGETQENNEEITENVVDDAIVYGPKIPENLRNRLEKPRLESVSEKDKTLKPTFRSKYERDRDIEEESSSSSDSWVEVKESESKKHKKKKKHKSKHKKSKHKKKKSKRKNM